MRKVIFPSALVVPSELQSAGKLPAIIYPIDQKDMISLFKEHYFVPNGADSFDIVIYEAYAKVVDRIKQTDRIRLWKLDNKKDIGYTIWYGLSNMKFETDDSLVINFADVIVFEKLPAPSEDICYYETESISSKWTFFNEVNGEITDIYDKLDDTKKIKTNNFFIGLFSIAHPDEFFKILDKKITGDYKEDIDSLYSALRDYSQHFHFNMIRPREWFDIGHIDKYYDAQLAIKSRSFNHIIIDRSRGILTKYSDNKEKLIDEIKWYLKLPSDIEYIRPRIFRYSLSYDDVYVSMEYYAYHTLHELFLYGALTEEQWINIFKRIRFILKDMGRYTTEDDSIEAALKDMYLHKTVKRMEILKQNNQLIDFDKSIFINGKNYLSLNDIMKKLPQMIKNNLLNINRFCIIHGDMCFSNILIDSNYSFVKCIDPRGSFGSYDIYGDPRYDIAKLLHSIEGLYDYIIKDMYELKCNGNEIIYQVHKQEHECSILEVFQKVFYDELREHDKEIKLIESLLFISMIPLHTERRDRQLAMLATGLSLLGEIENIQGSDSYVRK